MRFAFGGVVFRIVFGKMFGKMLGKMFGKMKDKKAVLLRCFLFAVFFLTAKTIIRESCFVQAAQAGSRAGEQTGNLQEGGSLLQEVGLSSFDPEDWRLILVNKQHPIPDDYDFELGSIHNGHRVDRRIAGYLDEMLEAAKEEGVNLLVISPYRDPQRQKNLFDKKVKKALKQGDNYLEAYKETAQAVTIPGSSEHEIGLAVDLTTKEHITLDAEYADSEGGKWLSKHCAEYGFILRYPVGKEEITGIEFEPWHFRYVGKKAAAYMTEHGLTLEEFTELIREQ